MHNIVSLCIQGFTLLCMYILGQLIMEEHLLMKLTSFRLMLLHTGIIFQRIATR